jgi:phage/plasmid-like protein (TIGR03299 family)
MSTATTTSPVDVNAAFAAERARQQADVTAYNTEATAFNALSQEERGAQSLSTQQARFDERVKSGSLVQVSPGRYQSTEGWDRGETFELRQGTIGDRQMLLMPEHGLDMDEVTGRAKLYTAAPAWHGLGQYIPGGVTDIDEVIALGQLDVPAVTIPVPDYRIKGLAGKFSAPGQFLIANGNTGEFWGMVGKVHRNVPVRGSFEFLENLLGQAGITWESAGLMGGGRRVFISCKVPSGVTIDAEGINERGELFVVVQDARDGSAAYRAMVTPWRPLCQNTNRFALRDAVSTVALRHTSGLQGRLEQARMTLGMTVKYAAEFGAEETLLARTTTTMAEAESLLAEFFTEKDKGAAVFGGRNKPEESTRTRLANDRREDDLNERMGTERGRVGTSLYMVEQAATGYLDWGKVRKGTDAAAKWTARIEASLAGDDDTRKTGIHKRLMEVATNR